MVMLRRERESNLKRKTKHRREGVSLWRRKRERRAEGWLGGARTFSKENAVKNGIQQAYGEEEKRENEEDLERGIGLL